MNCTKCNQKLSSYPILKNRGGETVCFDCLALDLPPVQTAEVKPVYRPGQSGLFKKHDGTEFNTRKR